MKMNKQRKEEINKKKRVMNKLNIKNGQWHRFLEVLHEMISRDNQMHRVPAEEQEGQTSQINPWTKILTH